MAGIIGGTGKDSTCSNCFVVIKGIAPNVTFINLRALDKNGQGSDSSVINAINKAIQLKSTYNIRVLNLSLGRPILESYTQDPLCKAVEAEWNAGIVEVIARQSAAMAPRLFPEIPQAKHLCFYPMDRKRGEKKNWYEEPMAERQRLMHEHGVVGRRYAGCVKQIITGSIGFDDWEWGVDLFADDPLVFKKLIYEMRFDEVSAVYALFGSFYVGLRVAAQYLGRIFNGDL